MTRLNLLGRGVRAYRIAGTVADPINTTFDPRRRRLVILPGRTGELVEIRARAGVLQTATLRRYTVTALRMSTPSGMAVDPGSGALLVLDAGRRRIVKLQPGSRGFADAVVSAIDFSRTGLRGVRGLAFDPFTGHFHVRSGNRLIELGPRGAIVAARDISRLRLRNPQGFTFAPSGDTTDDRARTNLYLTDAGRPGAKGSGQIVEISLDPPDAVSAISFKSALVKTVNMAAISPPSPDPSGIAYIAASRRLVVVDGEVEEVVGDVTHFRGANMWETALAGEVLRTANLSKVPPGALGRTDEPTDIAWNPSNGHWYVSDDDRGRVYDVSPGPDAVLGTGDDTWAPFDTRQAGNGDPEGIAYDAARDRIFVADGVNQEVYEYTSAGEPVGQFDVSAFGVVDPEGIEYNPDRGTLFVLGDGANPIIVETSTSGALLRTFDFSAAGAFKPAGLAYAPASDGSGRPRFYVVDRGVDNNVDPEVVDGRLFELTAPTATGRLSEPPKVDAGPDRTVAGTDGLTLDGQVADDGAPNPPGAVTARWSQLRGPGTVSFGNARAPATKATFSIAGVYTLRLTATDGEWTSVDDVTISVDGGSGVAAQDIRVAASSDDAEETTAGAVTLTSTDIDLMIDTGSTVVSTNLVIGMRFKGVAIPRRATVTNAFVQFQADEVNSEPTELTIRGQADDNAATFTKTSENISSRPSTRASVRWAPAPWPKVREATVAERSPNLKAVIQEIVNRPGWAPGNALVVLVRGAPGARRVARAFDTRAPDGRPPVLHVEWQEGPG